MKPVEKKWIVTIGFFAVACLFSFFHVSFAQDTNSKNSVNKSQDKNIGISEIFKPIDTLFPTKKKGDQNEEWEKIIRSSPKSIILQRRPFYPGESLFIGVQKEGNARKLEPVVGYQVPKDAETGDVWSVISIVPPPFEDPSKENLEKRPNMTRFYIFEVLKNKGMILPQGIEWTWLPEDTTEKINFFKPRFSHVPVNVSKTEVYSATFAKHKNKTYSLVVAVTRDRSKLKKIFEVKGEPKFNWDDWFIKTK